MPGGIRGDWLPQEGGGPPAKHEGTKPITSKHDPSPYVPPSSGGSNGGGESVGYAADPVLSMAWTQIPDYTGMVIKPGGSGPNDPKEANPHNPAQISLPSVRAAENSLLSSIERLVQGYNNLHEKALNAIQTQGFYGEDATYVSTIGYEVVGQGQEATSSVHPDTNIQDMAKQFDQVANPMMTRALRQVADTITALGQFTNGLNLAGQAYTDADHHSYFPPPNPAVIDQHSKEPDNDKPAHDES